MTSEVLHFCSKPPLPKDLKVISPHKLQNSGTFPALPAQHKTLKPPSRDTEVSNMAPGASLSTGGFSGPYQVFLGKWVELLPSRALQLTPRDQID